MRDHDIRYALHQELKRECQHFSDALIIDELGLCCGSGRIDIGVITDSINGYEIKSAQDSLQRLPKQLLIYGRVLDQLTIVAESCHIRKIESIAPAWCGINEALDVAGRIQFRPIRAAQANVNVDPYALAELLWRDEALAILKEAGRDRGVLSKPRSAIWKRLTEIFTLEEISGFVRHQLKARDNWRMDAPKVAA